MLAREYLTYKHSNRVRTSEGVDLKRVINPEVYIDESYCNVFLGSGAPTWFGPRTRLPEKKSRGERFNIIGAGVVWENEEGKMMGDIIMMNYWPSSRTEQSPRIPQEYPFEWGNVTHEKVETWFSILCKRLNTQFPGL